MGRPRREVDVLEILRLRLERVPWPEIASRLHLGQGTAYRAYRSAIDAIRPFQNAKARKCSGAPERAGAGI